MQTHHPRSAFPAGVNRLGGSVRAWRPRIASLVGVTTLLLASLGASGNLAIAPLDDELPLPLPVDPDIRLQSRPPAAIALDPELNAIWVEGVRYEEQGKLLEATAFFEWIAASRPSLVASYWRSARNYWRFGEALPLEDLPNRQRYFELSESWAERGLSTDPECAECILWKIAATGRLGMTRGIVGSIRQARVVEDLIETGIRLDPQHRDNEFNSTLANLYYTGAVFYRLVPDWFWMKWIVGVRGDKGRAHEYIRRALAISGSRIDYHVELGAILLCRGYAEDRPELVERGRQVLARVASLQPSAAWEQRDVAGSRLLLDYAERACDYSAVGWIDFEEALEESGEHAGR